jgi:hypothetical protein
MITSPKLICVAVRNTTGSVLRVEIPDDVRDASEAANDVSIAAQWVGEEFNWQFIPMKFEVQ